MKKIFIALIIAVFTMSVYGLEAKVVSVEGKAQVQRTNGWVDLKPGMRLAKGDLVQTGYKSQVLVTLTGSNENSKLTIGPLSRLTIEQLTETSAGDKTSVHLATGSVKSEIKKTQDRRAGYTVRSPVATASVRGTTVLVKCGFDSTDVVTIEGSVVAWKTDSALKNPQIADKADESEVELPSDKGNSTKNIAPHAPAGAYIVSKDQSSSFTSTETSGVKAMAQKKTAALASLTQTAMAGEAISTTADSSENVLTDSGAASGGLKIGVILIPRD